MKYFCCLCEAVAGEIRPGRISEGGGVPLCAEHHARSIENARKPMPPPVVTADPYLQACTRAALAGDGYSLSLAPLANLAVPTTRTLQ